ncbi:MAG: hypothetical protein HYZ54_13095 [Ignavibacteriae bacterium]|nr:hypothetical protein [Ignavibacteriota bacterium]
MTYKFILVSIAFIVIGTANVFASDSLKDTIRIEKAFGGNSFFIDDKQIPRGQLVDILLSRKHTRELMIKGKNEKIGGYIAIAIGQYFMLGSLAVLSSENATSGTIVTAAIAVGLTLFGLDAVSSGNNKFYKAINIYNNNLTNPKLTGNYELNLKIDVNKVTLSLNF